MNISLLDLPNEDLVNICEYLDTSSLWNVMRSNSQIYQACNTVMLKRLKQDLFEYVTSYYTPEYFNYTLELSGGLTLFGFNNHQEFVDFQRDFINNLTGDELRKYQDLRRNTIPSAYIFNARTDTYIDSIVNFVFDFMGRVIFIAS